MENYFADWSMANNFDVVHGGRILILWNPATTALEVVNKNEQANSSGSIRSKLDRAMINNTWLEIGWLCRANFLPSGMHSDHSPVEVNLFGECMSTLKPFKFHNIWIRHPKFLQLIEEEWIDRVYGTDQFRFAKKLKEIQKHLKKLNKDEFDAITCRAKDSKRELEEAQRQIDIDPRNLELRDLILILKKKALFHAEAER
ncbi:hypothetical protein C2S52_019712 [Perilla frutescens var. hirtella]|nr:hypothetical protein C2S52_019712 [Perilla frutescens var. hirtella]